MGKNGVEGKFFVASGNRIESFGLSLSRSGSMWILDDWIQVEPETVEGDINSVLFADIEAGKGEAIDHVLIPPRLFNILCMEGVIKLPQLTKAEEDLEEGSILVRGIKFSCGEFAVKVRPGRKIAELYGENVRFATIDAQGEIV